MADTVISIGLSPEEVIAALRSMGEESKRLQKVMEDALGKKASESVNTLKDTTEKGTNQITKFFSNMGTRIKEDLKTAFDVSSVLAGANFAKQIGEGVKQVFDMERAFDRLNVRMGLSAKAMAEFKLEAGRAVAATGLNIKDVQPGLMAAASRGNVKDPQQMTMIAQALAQSKQINPELDTGTAAEDVAEILKRQGQQVNGTNFRQTLDAINSATVHGGFKSSGDAAAGITAIAPYAQQLGLDTRSMAGLAAVASKGGDSGENVLSQLLRQGTGMDQGAALNGVLGSQIFKNGKLDPRALANVDTSRFGNITPQILESTTGITGASGADLKMFIESWRQNMGEFDAVIKGSNETADQFGRATNNFAAQLDMFKARVTNAGQAIGDSLMEMVSGVMHGDPKHEGGKHLASALWENKGDLAVAGGLSLGAGLLMGGGIRGLVGGAAASAAGIQKVYVTNAAEISEGSSMFPTFGGMKDKMGGLLAKGGGYAGGLLSGAGSYLSGLGGSSVGSILAGETAMYGSSLGAIGLAGAGVGLAGVAGYGIGSGINNLTGNEGGLGEKLYDWLNPDELKEAVKQGIVEGTVQVRAGIPLTNPSSVGSRGMNVGAR